VRVRRSLPRAGGARALAPAPAVVLLDEPFSNLDRNLRTQIRADTLAVLRETGTAAVLVTHDQQEALATGDRVAVMRAGRIEDVGPPDRVFHAPTNRFVAAFMGDADFLPARVHGTWLRRRRAGRAGRRDHPDRARRPCGRTCPSGPGAPLTAYDLVLLPSYRENPAAPKHRPRRGWPGSALAM